MPWGSVLPALEIFNKKSRDYSTYKAVFPIKKMKVTNRMGFCNPLALGPRNHDSTMGELSGHVDSNMTSLGRSHFFVEIHHHHKKDILLMEEAPVDMENIPSFFKGFILSRWCRISSTPLEIHPHLGESRSNWLDH